MDLQNLLKLFSHRCYQDKWSQIIFNIEECQEGVYKKLG